MRINVSKSENDRAYATWFDPECATGYWEGEVDNLRRHGLYRTAAGQWVRGSWKPWPGSTTRHWLVTGDSARAWLLDNGHSDAVARWFESREGEEPAVNVGGRPSIGGEVKVMLGDLKGEVDRWAAAYAVPRRNRGEAIRRLIRLGLESKPIPADGEGGEP